MRCMNILKLEASQIFKETANGALATDYIRGERELWKSYMMYTDIPDSFFDYKGKDELELRQFSSYKEVW